MVIVIAGEVGNLPRLAKFQLLRFRLPVEFCLTSTMKMSLVGGVAAGVGDGVCARSAAEKARITAQPGSIDSFLVA